ncbi:MAG: PhzF family phenazine biosynthesis protein [Solirubrobacteraceae bacterium]
MRSYTVADVFTDTPLTGNQVAVFLDAQGLGIETMQRAARELNLSETVFVLGSVPQADARIRIFTPQVELPFAGHPVLGTAFVLGELTGLEVVRLATEAGIVPVALTRRDEQIVEGEMEQPLPTWAPFDRAQELLDALGVSRSCAPIEVYDNGPRHVYVVLGDDAEVTDVAPDLGALAAFGSLSVSCCAVGDGHIKTRVFAPGMGVAEDPATGSAAGPLAVHLARHDLSEFGRRLEVRQGAEIGRPSTLYATAIGGPERLERVLVGGGAVIVARGAYLLD